MGIRLINFPWADWILDGMADVCAEIGGRFVDWGKNGYWED